MASFSAAEQIRMKSAHSKVETAKFCNDRRRKEFGLRKEKRIKEAQNYKAREIQKMQEALAFKLEADMAKHAAIAARLHEKEHMASSIARLTLFEKDLKINLFKERRERDSGRRKQKALFESSCRQTREVKSNEVEKRANLERMRSQKQSPPLHIPHSSFQLQLFN